MHIFRSNDKRKIAVKEIEQIVKQNVEKNNPTQIRKILDYCREKFIYTNHSQSRKGGLLAFSAISIAIASNVPFNFLFDLNNLKKN